MVHRPLRGRRSATTAVELAVVLPLVLLLIIGLMIGSMGVFYSNQVAYLASETARYASVHGGQYMSENATAIAAGTLPTVNKQYLATNITQTRSTALSGSKIVVTVTMNTANGDFDWDDTTDNNSRALTSTKTVSGVATTVNNTVTVTVTCQWKPLMYIAGPITLTSTWLQPMDY